MSAAWLKLVPDMKQFSIRRLNSDLYDLPVKSIAFQGAQISFMHLFKCVWPLRRSSNTSPTLICNLHEHVKQILSCYIVRSTFAIKRPKNWL